MDSAIVFGSICWRIFYRAPNETADTAQVIVRPPIAWGLALVVGLVLNWLAPLSFLPAALKGVWLGTIVLTFGLALFAWAIVTGQP